MYSSHVESGNHPSRSGAPLLPDYEFDYAAADLRAPAIAGTPERATALEVYKDYWVRTFAMKGRSTRRDYWVPLGVNLTLVFVWMTLSQLALARFLGGPGIGMWVIVFFTAANLLPAFTLTVRRLKDAFGINLTGLVLFTACVGWLFWPALIILLLVGLLKGTSSDYSTDLG